MNKYIQFIKWVKDFMLYLGNLSEKIKLALRHVFPIMITTIMRFLQTIFISALFTVQTKVVKKNGNQKPSKNRRMGMGGGPRGVWNHGVIGRDFNYVENQYIVQGPMIMNCHQCGIQG